MMRSRVLLSLSVIGLLITFFVASFGNPTEPLSELRRATAFFIGAFSVFLSGLAARSFHRGTAQKIQTGKSASSRHSGIYLFLLTTVLLSGALFRFYHLASLPPGLWYDEANHGLDAILILENGRTPILFPSNCGQEPLFKYMTAAAIRLVGPGISAVRSISASTGWLTIVILYLWLLRLTDRFAALTATALAAMSLWHVHFSRIAFRGILVPFFLVLFLFIYNRWIERNTPGFLITLMTGIFLGSGLYTYVAFRLVPFLFVFWIAIGAFLNRQPIRRTILARWSFWLGFIGAVIPLILAVRINPNLFLARMKLTSVFSEPGSPLLNLAGNIYKHLLVPLIGGDPIIRHGLPGRPPISPFEAVLFGIGLGSAFATIKRTTSSAALIFYFGLLLPGILSVSVQAPATLRTLGVIPAVYLLTAIGWRTLSNVFPRFRSSLFWITIIAVSAASYTANNYFLTWKQAVESLPSGECSEFGFCREETTLAKILLDESDPDVDIYLSPQLYFHPTIRFLTWGKTKLNRIYRPEYLTYFRTPDKKIRIYLNLTPRNLWWLRSSYLKNFFYFWKQTDKLSDGEPRAMVSYCYPRKGFLMHTSDGYLLSQLERLYPDGLTDTHGFLTTFTLPPLTSLPNTGESSNSFRATEPAINRPSPTSTLIQNHEAGSPESDTAD